MARKIKHLKRIIMKEINKLLELANLYNYKSDKYLKMAQDAEAYHPVRAYRLAKIAQSYARMCKKIITELMKTDALRLTNLN
jgi:hypothetical protein